MCGRFTLRTPGNLIIRQFALNFHGQLLPRYNIAPTQMVPVVRGLDRQTTPLRWGLVPFWSKEPTARRAMINARSETAATKPAFRNAFRKQRCLIPADGYFEWRREGKQKQPYWIRMQDDRPFLMAGLWERWSDRTAEEEADPLETFTILTTSANRLTSEIHDRMPVILGPNDYDRWLDPESQDADQLTYMLEPYDAHEMRLDAVSTRVNSARNDDPDCVRLQRSLFDES